VASLQEEGHFDLQTSGSQHHICVGVFVLTPVQIQGSR